MIPNSRVAIIGAGAAGLCAARTYLSAGFRVRVYESTSDIGGTWAYSPKPSATSSLYQSLRCNIPKQIMSFPHLQFPPSDCTFLSHREVLAYLFEYTRKFDLRSSISFNSPVDRVWKQDGKWHVKVGDDVSLHEAVVVANGHYNVPNPWRPVGSEHFLNAGRSISHSNLYKEPSSFRNRSVVVVGAGPSGSDIALEIASVARRVYLSHSNFSDNLYGGLVPQVPRVTAVFANGDVELANGKRLHDVDHILLCTGYQYVYPFLSNGTAGVRVSPNKRAVYGLVAHLIARDDPTLAFMGLPWKVIPFPLFDTQALFLAELHAGNISPAQIEELHKQDPDHGDTHERYYHLLADTQWEYRRRLGALCGALMPTPAEISIARDASVARKSSPEQYREREYYLLGPGPEDWRVTIDGEDVTGRDDPDSPQRITLPDS